MLRELGVPTVLCGQLEGHPYRDVFSTVYSDDEEGGRFAALAMKDRGRKDIVAVLGPQDNPAVVDRLRGYRTVLGEDLPGANVIYTGWNSGDGYQAMHQILAREIAFDGVLCGSDRIAAGVITALNEQEAYPFRRTFLSSASTITRLRRAASPHSRPSASPCAKKATWPPTLRST